MCSSHVMSTADHNSLLSTKYSSLSAMYVQRVYMCIVSVRVEFRDKKNSHLPSFSLKGKTPQNKIRSPKAKSSKTQQRFYYMFYCVFIWHILCHFRWTTCRRTWLLSWPWPLCRIGKDPTRTLSAVLPPLPPPTTSPPSRSPVSAP